MSAIEVSEITAPGLADCDRSVREALSRRLIREVRADGWFHISVAAYVGMAAILAFRLDQQALLRPFLYVDVFLGRAAWAALFALTAWTVARGVALRPRAPLTGMLEALRALAASFNRVGPRFVAGCLLFASLAVFYGTFTSIKNMLPHMAAFTWDEALADFDRILHGGVDPGSALLTLFGPPLTLAIDYLYSVLWGALLIGVGFWAAVSTRHAHLRRRFFLTFLLSWTLLGNLLAGLLLSAGPVYYGYVTGDSARFAALFADPVGSAPLIQDYLWRQFQSGDVSLGSGISAFPSIHLATATLIALFLANVSRRLAWFGILFVIVMQIGSMRLGWHYGIDGYASILGTLGLWWIASGLARTTAGQAA